ncbi:MAG: hypothetical protein JWM40_2930 [Frankiales bacterium]|nr:hypothetical protein [Frankiales bacterium]
MFKPTALAASLAVGVATVGGVAFFAMDSAQSTADKSTTTTTAGSGTITTSPNASSNGNSGTGNNGNGNGNGAAGNSGHPIGVTWTIDSPLQPGRLGTLAARISNQNNQAINVQSVSAVVNSASKAGCDKTWLTVGSFSGSQPVAANSSAIVNLTIQLVDNTVNQNACKGAKFNLTVNATAVQA